MFEIIFLGTSASAPSIHRGLSSAVVIAEDMRFMIDCGEGTQRQILKSGIGFKKLNHILLTHAHLDHILGLGGLISTFVRWESLDDIHIYGSKSVLDRVQTLIFGVVFRNQAPITQIHFHEVSEGILFEHKKFIVRAFPVTHRGKGCFAYAFEYKAHRRFLADKADALGVPKGPERGLLSQGESIYLKTGELITPDMVLGDPTPGTKIAFTGDIARTDNILEQVRNADALVCEATFASQDTDLAHQFGHITAKQAAQLAIDGNITSLLLTHISRRYSERIIEQDAQAIFPQSYVVRDFDHYIVRNGQPLEKLISSHD
ncbi:ribonuclease Z [Anaerolineales bacterium]